MYPPRPRIDPREIRPGRGWYLAAGLIALIFAVVGVGGFVWGLVTATGEGKIDKRFAADRTVTVHLATDPPNAIFAREASSGFEPTVQCAVTTLSGQEVRLRTPTGSFNTTVNNVTWYEMFVIDIPAEGDYKVTCRSSDTTSFATGKDPDLGRFFGGIFGGIVMLFVAFGGGVTGLIIAIVTGVKRGNHRKRLLAAGGGYGPR